MAQRDTRVKFERMPGTGLRMQAGGGWAWAFVDWQDNVIMVPVVQDIDRGVIEDALNDYWPTITTIIWPEDLDVRRKTKLAEQAALLRDTGRV